MKRKKKSQIKKYTKDSNRHVSQRLTNGLQVYEKMHTIIIKKTQIKTTMRYHHTPGRIAIIENNNNKF